MRHPWIVYLVHNDIEPVDLGQRVHLELATPASVLSHPVDIVVDIFIVLDKKLVKLLILFDVLGALGSELFVVSLVTLELVAERTK